MSAAQVLLQCAALLGQVAAPVGGDGADELGLASAQDSPGVFGHDLGAAPRSHEDEGPRAHAEQVREQFRGLDDGGAPGRGVLGGVERVGAGVPGGAGPARCGMRGRAWILPVPEEPRLTQGGLPQGESALAGGGAVVGHGEYGVGLHPDEARGREGGLARRRGGAQHDRLRAVGAQPAHQPQ